MESVASPLVLLVVGPPAVGKMSVAQAIAERTGLRLFHKLAEKPSKRDLEASERNLLELDARYRLNSGGAFDGREDWLRIDNTHMSPADVAQRVIKHFLLPVGAQLA